MAAPLPLSNRARRIPDSQIAYFDRKALETPGLISLAAGLVDESSFPADAVRKAMSDILSDPIASKAALQYGTTQGLPSLRAGVLDHYCKADGTTPAAINATPENVVISTGSQQMLYILGEVLFEPGDLVITEAPSYFVFHDNLKCHGAKVLSVDMDAEGMKIDELEALLSRLESSGEIDRLRAIYTVDYFQNPSGLTLSEPRRAKLVELAKRFSKKHRIMIFEDAAYRELRFEDRDLPSVKKYDPTNEYVVYSTAFSKPLAPGFKIGYSILPQELMLPVINLKSSHDFGSSNLSQHVIDRLLSSGEYQHHVEVLHGVYREKKNLMLEALDKEFADWPEVKYTRPAGGMFVWLTFPPYIDSGSDEMMRRALDAGVLFIPGKFSHVPDMKGNLPRNEARLSFGSIPKDQIQEGIRRLRKACRGLER